MNLRIIDTSSSKENTLQPICDFLKQKIDYYDWVGFYFKNGDKEELKLAEFAGEPTEYTIIPFGKGICGQVAVSNENIGQIDIDSHSKNPFTKSDEELLEYVCEQVAKIV